jgi:integrase
LRLDDIDWRAGEIVVVGKGARRDRLPLPADVGAAIAAYLRRGRIHAFNHPILVEDLDDGFTIFVGPDEAANLLPPRDRLSGSHTFVFSSHT